MSVLELCLSGAWTSEATPHSVNVFKRIDDRDYLFDSLKLVLGCTTAP